MFDCLFVCLCLFIHATNFDDTKTIFDDEATNVVMVNICSWVGSTILAMTEITILVKVTMIKVIWIMLHSIFDKIGIQDKILEIF
jgi:kynureninase